MLLFAGLPLFASAFSGPTQRPLRWVIACLTLLVGGVSALMAILGLVAAVIPDGDPMGFFMAILAAPVAFPLCFLGLRAIRHLRESADPG